MVCLMCSNNKAPVVLQSVYNRRAHRTVVADGVQGNIAVIKSVIGTMFSSPMASL